MGLIYKTTNLVNGKIYVGKDMKNRSHYLGSGLILKQAIKKYGKENFKKEVIEDCGDDKEFLSVREIFWIRELRSNRQGLGYNLTEGGTGGDTFTTNPNKILINIKRSKSLKGKLSGDKNPSKRFEVRIKISETLKRKYRSGEIVPLRRFGPDNPNTGQERTQEQKSNIKRAVSLPSYRLKKSESLKKAWKDMSEESKKERGIKISKALTGQKRTAKQNEHNRVMQKARFNKKEEREKASKSQKIRFLKETSEQKKERIQKLRAYYQNKKKMCGKPLSTLTEI